MRIVNISQTTETEAWLQYRLGKIGGSTAKYVKPLSRGVDRTPQGFWQLLAEKVSVKPDGEKEMERGHRLEKEALDELSRRYKLDIEVDCGLWESDDDEDISVSPDGSEKSDTPTWAVEVKCLNSANHLKFVIKDKAASKLEDYKPINSIPNDSKHSYKEQVVQYFVVNEALEKLYFVLYDDRVGLEKYIFHVITVNRSDILELIDQQKEQQVNILREVNALIAALISE